MTLEQVGVVLMNGQICDNYLISLQAGRRAIFSTSWSTNRDLSKTFSFDLRIGIVRHFPAFCYDLLSLVISIIGQVITRNSTSDEEAGYMTFVHHDLVITVSLVLQMIQKKRACG
jgi:hypothetical protein